MYYPSIFYSGYLITMTALLQEKIKAWLYKLKIFNENPLFCLKINNNMFFNLQILWCSDFTFLPHNHWKLLLKILFLDWESCIYIYMGVYFFEFGIFFPLLNAHRIWYLVHFFPLPNAQSFHWKTGYKIVLAMDFLTQWEIYNKKYLWLDFFGPLNIFILYWY